MSLKKNQKQFCLDVILELFKAFSFMGISQKKSIELNGLEDGSYLGCLNSGNNRPQVYSSQNLKHIYTHTQTSTHTHG